MNRWGIIRQSVIENGRKWPDQLAGSGVMFFMGERITIREFNQGLAELEGKVCPDEDVWNRLQECHKDLDWLLTAFDRDEKLTYGGPWNQNRMRELRRKYPPGIGS